MEREITWRSPWWVAAWSITRWHKSGQSCINPRMFSPWVLAGFRTRIERKGDHGNPTRGTYGAGRAKRRGISLASGNCCRMYMEDREYCVQIEMPGRLSAHGI